MKRTSTDSTSHKDLSEQKKCEMDIPSSSLLTPLGKDTEEENKTPSDIAVVREEESKMMHTPSPKKLNVKIDSKRARKTVIKKSAAVFPSPPPPPNKDLILIEENWTLFYDMPNRSRSVLPFNPACNVAGTHAEQKSWKKSLFDFGKPGENSDADPIFPIDVEELESEMKTKEMKKQILIQFQPNRRKVKLLNGNSVREGVTFTAFQAFIHKAP